MSIERAIIDAARAGTRAAAEEILHDVKRYAPVRSGRLRANVVMYRHAGGPNKIGYTVGVTSRVPYFRFLEQGFTTRRPKQFSKSVRGPSRVAARPFLAPGYESAQGKALAAFYAAFEGAIK